MAAPARPAPHMGLMTGWYPSRRSWRAAGGVLGWSLPGRPGRAASVPSAAADAGI